MNKQIVTAHRAPDLFGVFASLHDQPGLRMTYTLHQAACANLRHPAISYKHRGLLNQIVYPMSSYLKKTIDHAIWDDIQKSIYPPITKILEVFFSIRVHSEIFLVKGAKKVAFPEPEQNIDPCSSLGYIQICRIYLLANSLYIKDTWEHHRENTVHIFARAVDYVAMSPQSGENQLARMSRIMHAVVDVNYRIN